MTRVSPNPETYVPQTQMDRVEGQLLELTKSVAVIPPQIEALVSVTRAQGERIVSIESNQAESGKAPWQLLLGVFAIMMSIISAVAALGNNALNGLRTEVTLEDRAIRTEISTHEGENGRESLRLIERMTAGEQLLRQSVNELSDGIARIYTDLDEEQDEMWALWLEALPSISSMRAQVSHNQQDIDLLRSEVDRLAKVDDKPVSVRPGNTNSSRLTNNESRLLWDAVKRLQQRLDRVNGDSNAD